MYRYGVGGLTIDGQVSNTNTNKTGITTITNDKGVLTVNGNVDTNNAELTMTNNGDDFVINGDIYGTNNNVNIVNNNGGIHLNSTGLVNSKTNDVNITNIGTGGVNIKGLVNANQNVKIDNKNSNVVIGDNTENNNYVTAGKDIQIAIVDGSLLNYGVEKTLLKAGGNLNMDVTNGTIGLPVQQAACTGSGCTGVGPKNDGSRDFTKSINANITGKVNATTSKTTSA